MSYSFTVKGKTRELATIATGEELDKVVVNQPVHEADVGIVESSVDELLSKLMKPGDGEVYEVIVSASVSWVEEGNRSITVHTTVSVVKE
jgi:hypothetical protein